MTLSRLTLVTGGAASGKSRWAEGLVTGDGRAKTYIATATQGDAEMRAKIAKHRRDRGSGWKTIEAPLDLAQVISGLPKGRVVLVDCLTMWLSNQMLRGGDLAGATDELVQAVGQSTIPMVLVTNETGSGGVPDNALARAFQAEQGTLNQRIAAISDLVVLVTAGLPLAIKGALSGGRS